MNGRLSNYSMHFIHLRSNLQNMTFTSIIHFLSISISLFLIINGLGGKFSIEGLENTVLKTIKTKSEAMYDCVDFYEQPAFKHPLLKNHNFNPQMRPSSRPIWLPSKIFKMNVTTSPFHLESEGCPSGTVPIRRRSKNDLHQATLLSKKLVSLRMHSNNSSASNLEPGIHHAIIQTKSNPGTIQYYGVGARFSVWNPKPVQADQYSSGQFMIQNGLDSIQVGWHVNPTLYKDNMTHFFIHTSTGSGSHCFNTDCPGFVLVRSDAPPGFQFTKMSTRGGPIAVAQFFVYQDQLNGNWWLEGGLDYLQIGFWPQKIFSGLAKSGSYLATGGETYSPPDKSIGGPPMGTGDFVKGPGLFEWDAISDQFVTVNENHQVVDVLDTEVFSDNDRYQVRDDGLQEKHGHRMFFGGPGPLGN